MKNLKKIILMVLVLAITGASVNCQFRSQLERRSYRIRQNEVINQQRSGSSLQLSTDGRRGQLQRGRELSTFTRVVEASKLWVRNEYPELTQEDSEQIILILNGVHDKQNKFFDAFKRFILGHFAILENGVVLVNYDEIANTLEPNVNFNQLRQIYLDSILCNIKFIKNLFEDVFFLRLDIKPLDGLGTIHTLTLPLANFLRSNLFGSCFEAVSIFNDHLNIDTPKEDICVYYDYSNDVMNSFMFNFNIEQELDDLEYINEYLQIDFNFIVESFVRDIKNKGLESIEMFVQNQDLKLIEIFVKFVEQNFEENEVTEIFNRCLRILNPEHCDRIIRQLSNINLRIIVLRNLNITSKQLVFLLPILRRFTNLRWLDFSGNKLAELPESIGRLRKLKILYLSRNQLTVLPESIGRLRKLKYFDLKSNQLTVLPESIGRLRKLQWLDFSGNKLIELPAEFGQLTNLQELGLNYNQLIELPVEFGQLTNLKRLSFDGNKLKELPAEIGQLTSLKHLDLADNKLTGLPVEIGRITNILFLDLSGNKLTGLPAEIGRLTNLKLLDLRRTLIEGFSNYYDGRWVVQNFMNSYFNR